jgi:hypothetical protein
VRELTLRRRRELAIRYRRIGLRHLTRQEFRAHWNRESRFPDLTRAVDLSRDTWCRIPVDWSSAYDVPGGKGSIPVKSRSRDPRSHEWRGDAVEWGLQSEWRTGGVQSGFCVARDARHHNLRFPDRENLR